MKKNILILLMCLFLVGCNSTEINEVVEEPTSVSDNDTDDIVETVVDVLEDVTDFDKEEFVDTVLYDIDVEPTMSKYEFVNQIKSLGIDDYFIDITTNHILSTGYFPEMHHTKTINITGNNIIVEIIRLYNDESVKSKLDYYDLYYSRKSENIGGSILNIERPELGCLIWTFEDKAGVLALAGNMELVISTTPEHLEEALDIFYYGMFKDFREVVDFSKMHTLDFYVDTATLSVEDILNEATKLAEASTGFEKTAFDAEVTRYRDMIETINNKEVTHITNSPQDLRALLESNMSLDYSISIHPPHEDYNMISGNYHYVVDFPSKVLGNNVLNAYPVSNEDYVNFYKMFTDNTSNEYEVLYENMIYDKTGNTYYIFSGNIIYEFILEVGEDAGNYTTLMSTLAESNLRIDTIDMMKEYNN